MKTNTLLLVGLLGASLAGCDIRCLSSKGGQAPVSPIGAGKVNVHPASQDGTDAQKPGEPPVPVKQL